MDFRASALAEFEPLVDRLTAAADAAVRAARAEAAAEAQAAIEAITAEHASVEQELEQANSALEREKDTLRQTFEREKETLRGSFDRDKEALRAGFERDKDGARLALERERDAFRTALEAGRTDAAASQRELQARLDEAIGTAADTSARARDWRLEQGRAMRDQAVTFLSRSFDHLLALSTRFASVSTEDDVLQAVVGGLATEFSRVALFKVANNSLTVSRCVGFDFPDDPMHLVIPRAVDAALERAVSSGQVELLPADALADAEGTPFGGTPACALALPIDLDGDACAVVYADDSDHPHQGFANAELRRKFALLLRQLALPLLQRLPAEAKAVEELREYAARLIAELENMHAADLSARKAPADVRRRLRDNLECARGIYAQRISSESPIVADLLEQQLGVAVDRSRATQFGRDLSALVAASEPVAAEA